MPANYGTSTEGTVALAAGVAKTILGVKAASTFGTELLEFEVSFDGTSATAVPVLVELCYCTFATNSPGTASTSTTVDQWSGRTITAGFTAAKNWTTEPTVVTPQKELLLTPAGGIIVYAYPFDGHPDSAVSEGFVIRCNAPAAVNVRATMKFQRH